MKLESAKETFHIRLPADFTPQASYGVVVFISGPQSKMGCPATWIPVLDEYKLIYVAPQNAGNKESLGLRDARALTSALLIKKYYLIDPKRIYVAGYSGGARVAGMTGFKHPETWRGTIQSCGADFYKPVPRVAVTDEEFKKSADYGGIPDAKPASTSPRSKPPTIPALRPARSVWRAFLSKNITELAAQSPDLSAATTAERLRTGTPVDAYLTRCCPGVLPVYFRKT